ncbi:MAG: methyltransferase domain-containing protein [Candidatus Woesearchaeota archaeon]|jgi:SAM-dependent methyltransferase|nr:methyltransferase domain-containing protein [Candidatus Woesearchaeota archaeon]
MEQIDINNLKSEDIKKMNYNELISVVKETNRPPGGVTSLIEVAKNTFMNKDTKVLEVGTSTGFTALELARLVGCNITAIDINELSIDECKERAKKLELENIDFKVGNAEKLDFPDNSFDIVFCGNVTSIVNDREKALAEYSRVLKNGGYLIAIPMYYIKEPSNQLVSDVSDAIRVNIKVHDKNYWNNMFESDNLEILKEIDYKFDYIQDDKINDFVKKILSRDHLSILTSDARETLNSTYTNYIKLFRENLSHMGYSILILRKSNLLLDEELFTGSKL